MNLTSSASKVVRELATMVSTMTRSTNIEMAIEDMKNAVEELQNDLKSLPDLLVQPHDKEEEEDSATTKSLEKNQKVVPSEFTVLPLMEVIPLVSFASLLMETATRIEENVVKAVEELAESAEFKQPEEEMKPKQSKIVSDEEKDIALQRV